MTKNQYRTYSATIPFCALVSLCLLWMSAPVDAQETLQTPQTQGGSCFPTCRTGFVCNPANQCVSLCNPPCGGDEICTAEAMCIPDPALIAPAPLSVAVQPANIPRYGPSSAVGSPERPPSAMSSQYSSPAVTGSFRFDFGLDVGVGGSLTYYEDSVEAGETDLGTTFGFHLRGLFSLGEYVLLGPAISYRSMVTDPERDPRVTEGPERFGVLGLGAALGVHGVVDVGRVALDFYALLSLGLAVGLANEDAGTEGSEYGLDFALRGGTYVWFTETFGVNVSLGYQRADIYFETRDFRRPIEGHLVLGQFALGLGLSVRLGT